MAQPRQHHADLIAIRDFQLRLFMAQGLDEGHGQIGRADAVKETVVGGTWKISCDDMMSVAVAHLMAPE